MKNKNKYLLFALPSFILIFAIMLFPVGYAVVYSFTDYRLGKEAGFIGLENYISVLQDSEFISALIFTIILTVTAVLCQFVFGMIIALLLDNIHHFKKIWSIYRLPGNILEDLVIVGLSAGNAVGIQLFNGAYQHGF